MINSNNKKQYIREIILECLRKKVNKCNAMKKITKEFNITSSEFSNMWIGCKAERIGDSKTKNIINHELRKSIKKAKEKENTTLKRISSDQIQGLYGKYKITEKGIQVKNKLYKNKKQIVTEWRNKAISCSNKLRKMNDELDSKIKNVDINIKEKEVDMLNKKFKEDSDFYEELYDVMKKRKDITL